MLLAASTEATAELVTDGGFGLRVTEAIVEVHRVELSVLESPAGPVAFDPRYRNETIVAEAANLRFEPLPAGRAYVHAYGDLRLFANATAWPLAPDRSPESYQYKMNSSHPFVFADAPPPDAAWFTGEGLQNTALRLTEEVTLFFAEGELAITTPQGTRKEALGTSQEWTAPGGLAARLRTDTYTFVTMRASADGEEVAVTNVHATASRVAFDGRALFHAATGEVRMGRTTYPLADGGVAFTGSGDVTLPARGVTDSTYRVEGEFSSLQFADGRATVDTTARDASIAASILAFALFVVTRFGREVLASILAAFYTRIKPSGVLQNPDRAALYAAIGARPGQALRELQRAHGSGWGTLHYHLSVLKKNGLVTVERRGKYSAVYHSTDPVRPALMLARRGVAARVYDALASGPRTQKELQTELGLSRQLVAHHLGAMVVEGLVREIRGRPKQYARPRPMGGEGAPAAVAPTA